MKVINIMVGCYWKTRKQDFIGDITPFCLNIQEKLHIYFSDFLRPLLRVLLKNLVLKLSKFLTITCVLVNST